MTTVRAPAARKSHLKKLANASFAIIPLKSGVESGGCWARSIAATPSTASAAAVR
jgi:hypothetical protein